MKYPRLTTVTDILLMGLPYWFIIKVEVLRGNSKKNVRRYKHE